MDNIGIRNKKTNMLFKKIYSIWYNMNSRCNNHNHPRYDDYGGSGYYVCDRWKKLDNFILDIDKVQGFNEEELLKGNLSLDKDTVINGNKEYSLQTCAFISKSENNKFKPNQQKEFKAISPDGTIYYGFNQSDFAKMHNLSQCKISMCLNMKVAKHKGWQ